ncbi:hypothetical protein Cst_c13920 [Thermoclostridium stercorarium subsp. stercorarium DSM 8532]|uniref:Uncharacterized protein n=1 Tax=Thermoclostridium stercorarium (strain ATCC 35414 / DSM 8532 / NCIMB 11754) TaxID=1121335 RepID=L7VS27_THES1|nr:hypothetical protein Cst_c13920 [Thermoclostridium stercorarium subsp. stercorarium DSM 8532]
MCIIRRRVKIVITEIGMPHVCVWNFRIYRGKPVIFRILDIVYVNVEQVEAIWALDPYRI